MRGSLNPAKKCRFSSLFRLTVLESKPERTATRSVLVVRYRARSAADPRGEHRNIRSVHREKEALRSPRARRNSSSRNELRASTLKKDRERKPRFGRERPGYLCGFAAQMYCTGSLPPKRFV